MKYTTGEWKLGKFNDCIESNDTVLFEQPHGGEGKTNFEANAKLAIAALGLLRALEMIRDFDDDSDYDDPGAIAIEAIKKAIE